MKYIFPLLSVLFPFLYGCTSQGVLHEYQGTIIAYGTGGGMSGKFSDYRLSTDGTLKFTEIITGKKAILPKVKKSDVKDIYTQLKEINFQSISFNHPGDVYYFLKQSDAQSEHKVVWGDTENPVPQEVQKLYDLLVSSMN